MMGATAFRIGFGENDPVAGDTVDSADMLVVVADDFHMLADLTEQAPLLLAPLAPAAKIAFEARLMFAAIILIVAIDVAEVPLAPATIVRVELAFTFA